MSNKYKVNSTSTDSDKNQFAQAILSNFFSTDKSPLEKFHGKWKPFDKNKLSEWSKYYIGLYEFLNELNQCSEDLCNKNRVVIEKISNNYFSHDKQAGLGKKDFFLFANITSGVYYFGDVNVNAQTSIFFEGTILRNKHLETAIKALYDGFKYRMTNGREEST